MQLSSAQLSQVPEPLRDQRITTGSGTGKLQLESEERRKLGSFSLFPFFLIHERMHVSICVDPWLTRIRDGRAPQPQCLVSHSERY